jgi:hypothetical protein
MPIIPTTFDTIVLTDAAISGILRAAVQAVVAMKVRFRVPRRYAHTEHLCRDAEQGRAGREVIRRLMLRADMRRVKMCALETMRLPWHRNICQTLRMKSPRYEGCTYICV